MMGPRLLLGVVVALWVIVAGLALVVLVIR